MSGACYAAIYALLVKLNTEGVDLLTAAVAEKDLTSIDTSIAKQSRLCGLFYSSVFFLMNFS